MKYFLIAAGLTLLTSCNWFKHKTKETAHKSGEVVAQAGSEFADGLSEGVEKTFGNEVQLSEALQKEGIKIGKTIIRHSDSATDNVLSVYLIFDKAIQQEVTVKVFSEAGQEYGRARQLVTGAANDARYIDFVFDKRTNIDGKGKVVIE